MKWLRVLFLLPAMAQAQTWYNQTDVISNNTIALTNKTVDCNLNTCLNVGGSSITPIYIAKAYGSCTWDATHDVGACINLAIAAAVSATGGTIMLPCGTFGLTTQVLNQSSGVHLQGCGLGISGNATVSPTRLKWIGNATSNPALLVQTASGGGPLTLSANVSGIAVDCNALCDVAIKINGVSYSDFEMLGTGAVKTNVWFTTPTDLVALGNQHDTGSIYSYDSGVDTNNPTGILFDAGCTFALACFNTSLNQFTTLTAWYHNGDGIVFGDSDNNDIELVRDIRQGSSQAGSAVVCANSNYTMPNGNNTVDRCQETHIYHDTGRSMHIAGFQTGSTFVAAGGNTGTAALNPTTLTTSSGSTVNTSILIFTSTTGVAANESVSCGGPVNGIFNGTPVSTVTSTQVSIAPAEFIIAVPNSTVCTFTYGILQGAHSGTYTLTATSSSQYTLTAPAGGHTQSGITASGGFLTFTDMVIPWTGTPVTNDSWTITVPIPPNDVRVDYLDRGNHTAVPTWEAGSTGAWSQSDRPYPVGNNQQCVIGNVGASTLAAGTAAGYGACAVGGDSGTASGLDAIVLGGVSSIASGSYAVTIGGSATASGFAAVALGQGNTSSGQYGFTAGAGASDRGRTNVFCYGGSRINVAGDNQVCFGTLHGSGATGSAIRLTATGAAQSNINCFNLPANSAFAITMDIVAFDKTTVTKFASWNGLTGLLTQGANAAATALAVASATPAVTYSGGTLTGNSMSLTADTTNGCINISWTPPTSNTDTWDVVATIRSTEVQ